MRHTKASVEIESLKMFDSNESLLVAIWDRSRFNDMVEEKYEMTPEQWSAFCEWVEDQADEDDADEQMKEHYKEYVSDGPM